MQSHHPQRLGSHLLRVRCTLAGLLLCLVAAGCGSPGEPAGGESSRFEGTVSVNGQPLQKWTVELWVAGSSDPLASTSSDTNGKFSFSADIQPQDTVYLTATFAAQDQEATMVLANVPGTDPERKMGLALDEFTTVASGYALAQFWQQTGPGKPPLITGSLEDLKIGIPNAASMWTNLANHDGGPSGTLTDSANQSTQTMSVVNSLADLVVACLSDPEMCVRWYSYARTPPKAHQCSPIASTLSENTVLALSNMAKFPSNCAEQIHALIPDDPPYPPVAFNPDLSWVAAIRFAGAEDLPNADKMDGPGNFAIDRQGSVWIVNNYEYQPPDQPEVPACASDILLRLNPDGSYYEGSPYRGNQLYGVGYGVEIRPSDGTVWAANFGFNGNGCVPNPSLTKTASVFSPDGKAMGAYPEDLEGGFEAPQGLAADADNRIWVAGCGSNNVYAFGPNSFKGQVAFGGDTDKLEKPFDVAATTLNGTVHAFATGNNSNTVIELVADGDQYELKKVYVNPGEGTAYISRPMGIEVSSGGTVWVANSNTVDPPCPPPLHEIKPEGGFLSFFDPTDPDGVMHTTTEGGVFTAWGLFIDSNDDVWVANFSGQKLSRFCGTDGCIAGLKKGEAYSLKGYYFDGLARNTAVAVDPSGNVWLTNNWKESGALREPNPGGYQVVAFVGLGPPTLGKGPQS